MLRLCVDGTRACWGAATGLAQVKQQQSAPSSSVGGGGGHQGVEAVGGGSMLVRAASGGGEPEEESVVNTIKLYAKGAIISPSASMASTLTPKSR